MTDWKKVEKKVVRRFGGKPTPASGALWWQKGDGKHGSDWRIEVKSTEKETYRVTAAVLEKLRKDAKAGGTPILIVNFYSLDRQVVVAPIYVLHGWLMEAPTSCPRLVPEEHTPLLNGWTAECTIVVAGHTYWVLPGDIAKTRLRLA